MGMGNRVFALIVICLKSIQLDV